MPGGGGNGETIADLIDAIERYDNQQANGKTTVSDLSKLRSEAWKNMRKP